MMVQDNQIFQLKAQGLSCTTLRTTYQCCSAVDVRCRERGTVGNESLNLSEVSIICGLRQVLVWITAAQSCISFFAISFKLATINTVLLMRVSVFLWHIKP